MPGPSRLGHADGHEEHDGGLLTLAVHAHLRLVFLIDLELGISMHHGSTIFAPKTSLIGGAILLAVGQTPGERHELGDDDSLGAADDEGTPCGARGAEIAHEHGLGLDSPVSLFELGIHVQRCGVGVILLLHSWHGDAAFGYLIEKVRLMV